MKFRVWLQQGVTLTPLSHFPGENNMGGTKGSALANVGYSCEQKALVTGWRKVWSETPGTTQPDAPFGIVTLASSGSEGGPDMGAMRLAQTAGYGVLPGPAGSGMENTFLAQAFDLDDPWGPSEGPCLTDASRGGWGCCDYSWGLAGHSTFNATTCPPEKEKLCESACVSSQTKAVMGGIHPRWKKPVGDRLAIAAFNTIYGGTKAYTGPTLSGCSYVDKKLTIEFNASLLRGDSLVVGKIPAVGPGNTWQPPKTDQLGSSKGEMVSQGSQLYVQTDAKLFCIEKRPALNSTGGSLGFDYCPKWAGGDGSMTPPSPPPAGAPPAAALDSNWILVNYTKASDNSITVDLAPLNGSVPTAVQ